eukprot:TRINITY_DN6903_c0_g1_i2.p1 TRINITY_DN6903_c0_g1~~TRINITY_DN6903_c0_g1_i2.p1  ORF type:complete len:672 (-),score=133.34 TRINITY_DN6903_c0_g1_i2:112-2127(-)
MIAHLKSPFIQGFLKTFAPEWQEKALVSLAIIGIDAVRRSKKSPTIENLKQMADEITGKSYSEEEISKELRMIRREIESLNEKVGRNLNESPPNGAKSTVKRTRFDEQPSNNGQRSVSAPPSEPIEAPKPPAQWRKGDRAVFQRRYYSPQNRSMQRKGNRSGIEEVIYPEWWFWSKNRSDKIPGARPLTGKVTEHHPAVVLPPKVKVRHHLDATLMKDALRDPNPNVSDRKPPLPSSSEKMNRTTPVPNKPGPNNENERQSPALTVTLEGTKKLVVGPPPQVLSVADMNSRPKQRDLGRIASQKRQGRKNSQQAKETTKGKNVPTYLRNVESKIKEQVNSHRQANRRPLNEHGSGNYDNRPFRTIEYGSIEDPEHEHLESQERDYSTVKYKTKDGRTPYRDRFTGKDLEIGEYSEPQSGEEAYGNQQTGHFRPQTYYGTERELEGPGRGSVNQGNFGNPNLLDIANSFLRSPLMQKFSSPESQNKINPSVRSRKDSSAMLVNVTAFDPKISLGGRAAYQQAHRQQPSTTYQNAPAFIDNLPSHHTYHMSKTSRTGDDNFAEENSASSSNFSVLVFNEEMKDFYHKEFFQQQNSGSGAGKSVYRSAGEGYFSSLGSGVSPEQQKYSESSSNLSEEKYQLNPRKQGTRHQRESQSIFNIFKRDGIDVSHLLSE